MQVADADVARIPVSNIRVPRAEFVAIWAAAEHRSAEQAERGITDWYAGGVVTTCRWLAIVAAPGTHPRFYSPITERDARAYEELIDAECAAAERLLERSPPAPVTARRPGWVEGIVATLQWAWRHAGPPPLELKARTG